VVIPAAGDDDRSHYVASAAHRRFAALFDPCGSRCLGSFAVPGRDWGQVARFSVEAAAGRCSRRAAYVSPGPPRQPKEHRATPPVPTAGHPSPWKRCTEPSFHQKGVVGIIRLVGRSVNSIRSCRSRRLRDLEPEATSSRAIEGRVDKVRKGHQYVSCWSQQSHQGIEVVLRSQQASPRDGRRT
jgi:hypothetical protein